MLRALVPRFQSRLILGSLFFSLLTLDCLHGARAWGQQLGSVIYFAADEVRLSKLLDRKEILDYRAVLADEKQSRETYFDTEGLFFYRQGMFYRIKEGFDGQARLEFYRPLARKERPALSPIESVFLSADKVWTARDGKLDTQRFLRKSVQTLAGREGKRIQLVAEYERHGMILERAGKREFFVSLLVGSFEGFSGRKFKKPFWALEIEAAAKQLSPSYLRELKRIADYLIPQLKLNTSAKSLYAQGIEKTVLLRPDERLIQPVRAAGGIRGNWFEQFDMPDGVAFTRDGKLLAGDTDNARFKIYNLDELGQSLRIIGHQGSGPGEFDHSVAATIGDYKIYNQVQGITVDRNGLVYVVDQGNKRIQVFDAEGKVLPEQTIQLTFCGKENPHCASGLWRPSDKNEYNSVQGLANDSEGAIFLSDKGVSRVYRFLPDGRMDPDFNMQEKDPVGKPTLVEPESMAIYQDKLFVSSEATGDIRIFDRKTGKLVGAGEAFGRDVFGEGHAEGVAVVRHYLLTVDVENSRISVFDVAGERPKFLLGFVSDLFSPDGIAIDPTGKYVAVADQGHLRILLFSLQEILDQLERVSPNG